MQEMLLQFIWQYSLYRPSDLATTEGWPVLVVHPGRRNTDAGPDFLEARIRIGNTLHIGSVELHIHSRDWLAHGHQYDEAYRNVVLHVVYRHNPGVHSGSAPVLELAPFIPPEVIHRYTHLIETLQPIPCARQLQQVRSLTRESWLDRLLAERWEGKLEEWAALLDRSAGNWQELLYWRMAANFGFRINSTPFFLLARSLPLQILARHRHSLLQMEALLFGQAGMLQENFEEEYPRRLREEYRFLSGKYGLQPIAGHLWKHLRLRPANFPAVRIAQLAMLLYRSDALLAPFLEPLPLDGVEALLSVTASPYWDHHFRFDVYEEKAQPKRLGKSSVHNLIINTVAPVRFLYAHRQGKAEEQRSALQLLEEVPAEDNAVLRRWAEAGWRPVHAGQSQALLQLYERYCTPKRCLECAVGLSIIRSGP